MQPNQNPSDRSALVSAAHSKSYDPSAPYRALFNQPPPSTTTNMPSSNPNVSQDVPLTNIDPRTGVIKRIPQFYYPRYKDADDPPMTYPDENEPNPYVQPPPAAQQPISLPVDPYGAGQYYPYGTPYLIPLATNAPPPEPVPLYHDQGKSDVIAAHQKDADLSRLEVYHFTPKQGPHSSTATTPGQPIIQYHVYPYPPSGTAAVPQMPVQQLPPPPFPSYPHPWYTNQPHNIPPYVPDSNQTVNPPAETKARGSQTEPPTTKNRAVSPIQLTSIAPVYDEDGYPYIHHRTEPIDRHKVPTGRIDRRFYDTNRITPISDCRCLDCQKERSKIVNYYPD